MAQAGKPVRFGLGRQGICVGNDEIYLYNFQTCSPTEDEIIKNGSQVVSGIYYDYHATCKVPEISTREI